MPATADAVIIGGGVMGCSILYNLADLGLTNTLLLERDVLASGSTSKSQAILRMHYSNEVTSSLAWKSLEVFRNFEELTGTPSGYTKTGYFLIVGSEDRQAMYENVAMHRRLGIASEIVSIEDMRELAPMLAVEGDESFAYESESGYADPYSVTLGFANRAREMGARVQDGTTVTGIEVTGDKVTAVLTADDRIETDIAVVAAGPWSDRLLRGVGVEVPIRPLRHQVVVLRRSPGPESDHPVVADNLNGFSARPDIGGLDHDRRRRGRVRGRRHLQSGRRYGCRPARIRRYCQAHTRNVQRRIPGRVVRRVHRYSRLASRARPH